LLRTGFGELNGRNLLPDLLRTGFGELNGRNLLPVKFAEAFGFGRAKKIKRWSTGMSDLVLSSPDGESGRPVGKDECLGDPKGGAQGCAQFTKSA
jgi:hypothetical protein